MIKLFYPLLLLLMFVNSAYAGEEAYSQASFDKLQQQGLPVLISIHADWCPTCRAQAPIISKLLQQGDYQRINALRVDFDQQKEAVQAFKATAQSTLIVFKGGKEVSRSLGDTSEAGIEKLLRNAL